MTLTQAVDLVLKILTRNPGAIVSMLHEIEVIETGHSQAHWRSEGVESAMLSDMITLFVKLKARLSSGNLVDRTGDTPTKPVPKVKRPDETPDEG